MPVPQEYRQIPSRGKRSSHRGYKKQGQQTNSQQEKQDQADTPFMGGGGERIKKPFLFRRGKINQAQAA